MLKDMQEQSRNMFAPLCTYHEHTDNKEIFNENKTALSKATKDFAPFQDKDAIYWVKEPILGSDYDAFFPNYELVASDGSIFGFKTEDNFHSQLRLYKKKSL